MKRLHALDVMRSLALLFMVLIHFADNLTYWQQQTGPVYGAVEWGGIMSAPMFTFLVGASFWLAAGRRSAAALRRYTLRRGAAIFLFGLGHMLFNWGPSALFDWDILTFIGSALIILLLVHRWPAAALGGLLAAVWLASPFLRQWTNYNAHWNFALSEYRHAMTAADIGLGWLLHGTFPILPWIIFPLGGYLAGRYLFAPHPQAARRGVLLLGVGLAAGGLGWWGSEALGGVYGGSFTFYPAAPMYLLWMLGVDAALLSLLWLLLDTDAAPLRRWWQGAAPRRMTERFSRYALSLYILHHSAHLWPLYAAGWLLTGDRWYFYADAMPLATALWFAAAFLGAAWLLMDGWEAVGRRYSLEWLLARLVRG